MSEEGPPALGMSAVGSRLAGYRFEREIGHGGTATVYLAYDERLDRRVAVKVLHPEFASDEEFRRRFIQESRIAAAVDHPNIIPVFAAGEANGVLFLAMRYVTGGDVRALIDGVGPLPLARCCALIAQVASALDAAHTRGLVHRDIKPTNMLLELPTGHSRTDHVYLADFGLAKPTTTTTSLTQTGMFLGTLDYASPEQIRGDHLDGRADLYSLACATMEMLCGSPPFAREHEMAVLSAHLSEPPPSLAARQPGLPPAIDQVFARALAKAPQDRYERCLDFADGLLALCVPEAAVARDGPPTTVDPPPAPAPPPTWPPTPPPPRQPSEPQSGTRAWSPTQETFALTPGGSPGGPARPVATASPGARPRPGTSRRPARRRSRGGAVGTLLMFLVIAAAAIAYEVLPGPAAKSPSPPASKAAHSTGPAATVMAYFDAINQHNYARAWRLGGRNSQAASYSSFVHGYNTTAHDTVTILSVSGGVVTARLTARQTDGRVKLFQGTYTVVDGIITHFHVVQIR
jgi:serine/threonine protein kinase